MKNLFSLRNILICILFTIFLLFVKDNFSVVWNAICLVASIMTPFVIGFLFAYILNFPYKFFYNKAFKFLKGKKPFLENMRKPLAIICTYASVVAVLGFLIAILVPQIADNIASLVERVPAYIDSIYKWLASMAEWLNHNYNANIDIDASFAQLGQEIIKNLNGATIANMSKNFLFDTLMPMITSTTAGIYNFVMGIVISVYFLSAKEMLCRQVKRMAVAFIPIKYLPKVYEVVDITDTKCGRFLVGDIIDAAFIGVLVFITMSIFQLPYAALIAVLIGVTNIIPFFGPFIGAIPSAIILFLESPWDMLIFIAIVFVIQQLDGNLFKPKIIGSQVGLSSFWVLFSVIVGGSLFGMVGFILGTPIYAVIYTLVGKRAKNAIDKKGKIAQEALDFEVLNYVKIAAEQKKIREEKETAQKEKLLKFIKPDKHTNSESDDDNKDDKE
ncbi:AI-2E family transporter [uncultured Ruminococcus sp.]|jgi:predicted PurR-regulated permease PerM|uniref:AI-2E family transporter n=1 Tax=uncultured Ruminococcus sp. TaxID=165186 RepID=UPI0025FCDF0F|nr:AI-2E family transporter [uncultured Ruminococcus sp.]